MSFLPLTLGVGLASDSEGGGLKPLSKSAAEKILNQDGYACRFCGFQATKYQRVVPYEGKFVTACSFCEQAMSMERAGMMGSGVLIWLPEITQAELNHIARAIYVAKSCKDQKIADDATRSLEALMMRRTEAKKRLGTDDPLALATALHESMTGAERNAARGKLDGIRLMPLDKHMVRSRGRDINGFPEIVSFWRSPHGPFAKMPTSEWQNMFAKVAR